MQDNNAFFPLFMDLSDKTVAVVGGGRIASRRIRTLLPFCRKIRVIAPELQESLSELFTSSREGCCSLTWEKDFYRKDYLRDAFLVLACTDDPLLNSRICEEAKKAGAFVNNCSDKSQCDFYFPGIVRKDPVVIGITAGGKDHALAKRVREELEGLSFMPDGNCARDSGE